MITRLIDAYSKLLEYLLAVFLLLMVVLVFGNVVLRYGFNSGIVISEELSRWLFVWLTFMGAVVALKERGHLGSDMLISRLGVRGKKICLALSYALMLFMCAVLFKGSWEQTRINYSTESAVMQVSMSLFYASGMVFAVLGSLILLRDFYRLLTGQMSEDELSSTRESEDVPHGGEAADKQH